MTRTTQLLLVICAAAMGCGGGSQTDTSGGSGGGFITGAGGSSSATPSSNSSSSNSSSSSSSTTTGAGGQSTTTSSSTGAGGVGGQPPTCNDIGLGEPNETLPVSWPLTSSAIDDCDSSGGSISGTIAGSNDVDWFTYEGEDPALTFCSVDPTRSFSQSESGIRLCKYLDCFSGTLEFSCPGNTTLDSVNGFVGCCGSAAFTIDPVNCTGTLAEHVQVYIRVDQPNATASTCNDYTLNYHY